MMHDLTPLVTDHFTERGSLINFVKGILYRLKMRNIKKADAILTNSDWTKKDVIKYGGVDPKNVRRVYLGVDEEFKAQRPLTREERGEYILFVGGVEANKNALRLIQAFANLKSQNSNVKVLDPKDRRLGRIPQMSNLKLVMPGSQFVDEKKIETKMIRKEIKELNLTDAVEFPGFVARKDLVDLYRSALVFVYPSYYEGFGFPVLEAMASGTPVVCSDASSLPEVGGPPEASTVIYVDPFDVQSIAEGVLNVLYSNTAQYQSQIEKGLERAKKFSWQKCARETLAILKSCCYGD
jgi:glycosyltransferase involved in cell wall biosynthesis